jgi:hypothetical protein
MMGLSVVLTDYTGKIFERLDDPGNILHRLLPPSDEASVALLSKIDWYGDTYFNYLQLEGFLREWDQLAKRAETRQENDLVDGIKILAKRCQNERNLLRFIGD